MSESSPQYARRNVPLFIAFRVLFNARFYYPVLSILFVDLGLTLEQYNLLNVAWAITIVCLEIPSGAAADRFGRQCLVSVAAGLMVVEMALLAFAPAGAGWWLFGVLLLNRILGGAAEAAASGADEALAYDSLAVEGRESEWPRVLELLNRWSSVAFFLAMMIGAAVYDPKVVNAVLGWLGTGVTLDASTTLRFPLYLTLLMAITCFICTWFLIEVPHTAREGECSGTVETLVRQIREAGSWIWRTPAALAVILATVCFDSIVRLILTYNSNYLRLIGLPEWSFGLIGSCFAIVGFAAATLGRLLVEKKSMGFNYTLVGGLILVALLGISQAWKFWGVVCLLPLAVAMFLVGFFVTHYLNVLTDSKHRATVLSFRGMAINLAYGGIGLMYAGLTANLRNSMEAAQGMTPDPEIVFGTSLPWLPAYFSVVLLLLGIACWRLYRQSRQTTPT